MAFLGLARFVCYSLLRLWGNKSVWSCRTACREVKDLCLFSFSFFLFVCSWHWLRSVAPVGPTSPLETGYGLDGLVDCSNNALFRFFRKKKKNKTFKIGFLKVLIKLQRFTE